jgi:hypothetical protein
MTLSKNNPDMYAKTKENLFVDSLMFGLSVTWDNHELARWFVLWFEV